MSAPQNELADRIRVVLADEQEIREVSMFGGLSFMVRDRMVVAAQRDGGLLVRIDPARHGELTARPGARQAEMGKGRSMGPGWITVDGEALDTNESLASWMDVAMQFHQASVLPT